MIPKTNIAIEYSQNEKDVLTFPMCRERENLRPWSSSRPEDLHAVELIQCIRGWSTEIVLSEAESFELPQSRTQDEDSGGEIQMLAKPEMGLLLEREGPLENQISALNEPSPPSVILSDFHGPSSFTDFSLTFRHLSGRGIQVTSPHDFPDRVYCHSNISEYSGARLLGTIASPSLKLNSFEHVLRSFHGKSRSCASHTPREGPPFGETST
jgi:hypothetical protein